MSISSQHQVYHNKVGDVTISLKSSKTLPWYSSGHFCSSSKLKRSKSEHGTGATSVSKLPEGTGWQGESHRAAQPAIWNRVVQPWWLGTVEQSGMGGWGAPNVQCAEFTWRVSTMFSGWGRPDERACRRQRWRGIKERAKPQNENMWMKENTGQSKNSKLACMSTCNTAQRQILSERCISFRSGCQRVKAIKVSLQ